MLCKPPASPQSHSHHPVHCAALEVSCAQDYHGSLGFTGRPSRPVLLHHSSSALPTRQPPVPAAAQSPPHQPRVWQELKLRYRTGTRIASKRRSFQTPGYKSFFATLSFMTCLSFSHMCSISLYSGWIGLLCSQCTQQLFCCLCLCRLRLLPSCQEVQS